MAVRSRSFRPHLETLESRETPALLFVSNANDSGVGSLRQAILDSNATKAVRDEIVFTTALQNAVIRPATYLPDVTDPVTVDGSKLYSGVSGSPQANPSGRPLVELDGSALTGFFRNGLSLQPTASESVVRGLAMRRFNIALAVNGSNVAVEGCYLGLAADGTTVGGNAYGVSVGYLASGTRIGGPSAAQRNVISGNTIVGIVVQGNPFNTASTHTITIQGNYLGTDATGTLARGNAVGIHLFNPFASALVQGNIIAGSAGDGLRLNGTGAATVQANTIGTNADGAAGLGNLIGIYLRGNVENTLLGLTTSAWQRNVIAGNRGDGVRIDAAAGDLKIRGNLIGVVPVSITAVTQVEGNATTQRVQQFTVNGPAGTAGTFTLGYGSPFRQTAPLPYNADVAAVTQALRAIDVTATVQKSGSVYTISYPATVSLIPVSSLYAPLGNGAVGVHVVRNTSAGKNLFIGAGGNGTAAPTQVTDYYSSYGNLIGHNGQAGVREVAGSSGGAYVYLNRIFSSPKLIDYTGTNPKAPAISQVYMGDGQGPNQGKSGVIVKGSVTRAASSSAPAARLEVYAATRVLNGIAQDLTYLSAVNLVASGTAGFDLFYDTTQFNLPLGTYLLATVTDTDGNGRFWTSAFSQPVQLSWPMIANDALTPKIAEGGVATLTGRITMTLPGEVFGLRVNWGDGTPTQTFRPGVKLFAYRHRYLESGAYTVTYTAFNAQGSTHTLRRRVVVQNVAPTLDGLSLRELGRSGAFRLTGRIVDPGRRDTFTVLVNWGDGTSQRVKVGPDRRIALLHRYRQPGLFTVKLTITDDDGGSSSVFRTATAKRASGVFR